MVVSGLVEMAPIVLGKAVSVMAVPSCWLFGLFQAWFVALFQAQAGAAEGGVATAGKSWATGLKFSVVSFAISAIFAIFVLG